MQRGDVLEARKMIEPSKEIISFLRLNLEGAKAKALVLRENKKAAIALKKEQEAAFSASQKGQSRRGMDGGGRYNLSSSSGKSDYSEDDNDNDDKEYEEENAGSEANWFVFLARANASLASIERVLGNYLVSRDAHEDALKVPYRYPLTHHQSSSFSSS